MRWENIKIAACMYNLYCICNFRDECISKVQFSKFSTIYLDILCERTTQKSFSLFPYATKTAPLARIAPNQLIPSRPAPITERDDRPQPTPRTHTTAAAHHAAPALMDARGAARIHIGRPAPFQLEETRRSESKQAART